jgi:hypothetical protein
MAMTRTLTALTAFAVLVLLSALLALPSAVFAGEVSTAVEGFDLHLRLQKGDTYQFTTQIEQNTSRWVEDTELIETSTLALTQTVQVVAVKDDGAATLRVTYDRIAFKCDNDSGTYEFDSDNPPDELEFPANVYAALVGQSLNVKVSPTGKITAVTNALAVQMALTKALEGDSEEESDDGGHRVVRITRITLQGNNAAILANSNEAMRLLHDEKALREHLAFLAVVYADVPVAVGGTWSRTEKHAGQYDATYETTYTLVARDDGTNEIELAGTIKGDPKAKQAHTGITFGLTSGMTDLEGTQKGAFKLDESSGLVQDGTLSRSIKGNTSTFNPMVDPDNMISTPTTIDTTITIKGAKLAQPDNAAAPGSQEAPATDTSTSATTDKNE